MVVEGSVSGVHLVAEVNMLNPSTRIQEGDEIVQVSTVIVTLLVFIGFYKSYSQVIS